MPPRKRSRKNLGLEPNLYTYGPKNDYFRYKHPLTGKYHPMGKNRAKAQAAARQLNIRLDGQCMLVAHVMDSDAANVELLIDRFKKEFLPTRNLKPRSLLNSEYRLNRIARDIGKLPLKELTVPTVADYLDNSFSGDSYCQHRSILIQVCRFGITKGLLTFNPAEVTMNKKAEKIRQRMTIEQYHAIYQLADPWLKNAMDIGLITLQRAGDVVKMKFEDIKDNRLFVIQQKTEKHGESAYLAINIGEELGAVIKRASESGIRSPYIVHRNPDRRSSSHRRNDHWTAIKRDYLSRAFSEVRDKTNLFKELKARERPTFHEIRSLGGYLYEKAGYDKDFIRRLMGHTSEKMTSHYLDGHANRWTECSAELVIPD
ncbi:tyrosine-type recombinase/integrase [Spartinivicinus ruber]|uniref:tyrosine-type recombinase/integrase n=1 Tax=Spartinivicinus ruber TaxID=2683272 RepID=UPI0013D1CA89|nr:tyrosine-type recombinase/integrase [Spartinivicinus ruber]